VIGGGVGGAAILYWLARLGWTDIVLVERSRVTSGSTFHSAGLVGQLRGSLSLTRMMMNSVELYRTLGHEVGLETGWHEVGSLRLASSSERMEELARQAGWAKTFGLPLELVSAADAQRMFPPMSTDGVLGAAYLPTDGYIDPSQLTFAMVEGARRRGAEICEDTRVTGISIKAGRVHRVITDKGDIATELVVNAGGMFAFDIGRMAGVNVPLIPMAHEYLITRPSGLPLDMPTMRDPSLLVYYRPESGGLIMGGYERDPAPWGMEGIPPDFNGRLLEPDWDRFEPLMSNAMVRTPSLKDADVVRLVNGPEAFTPDGEFILGPTEVRGFWVAAGFCAHGLAGAGGMGRLVAEWIIDGRPGLDAWEMDSRRFGRHYTSREYTLARTREVYSTYYDVRYPGHERSAGRPLRVSPGWARPLVRNRDGSASTGSSRTALAVIRRFGRVAGPAGCGRPRSAPSTGPAGRRPPCSTSRRSRKSRSVGPARLRFSRASPTIGWHEKWAGLPTPRCSTRVGESSAISRSPAWPTIGSGSSPAPLSDSTTLRT
jgi:4-methylaminobutanoate oxidase (formaldehyde-forming)